MTLLIFASFSHKTRGEFAALQHCSHGVDILNWCAAEWALISTLLDPTYQAFGVEIVPLIAAESCDFVIRLIFSKAYFTGVFVGESLRVILCSRE